ncbi:MAG: hypothetical protein KAG98_07715 [Lentisphaeria bacterium]|nr:hypothetical protein [Lentisphaeria bacterium]
MWYILIACLAYWLGKSRASKLYSRLHAETNAAVEQKKKTEEKNQHCDMSLYLMQKSMTSNDAYEIDEWLKSKGILDEYNALLDKLDEVHQKKFNMSKAQLITLFEKSYLEHYERLTNQHESVLSDSL